MWFSTRKRKHSRSRRLPPLIHYHREPADNVGVEVRSVRWNPPVERSVDITGGVAEEELGIRISSENNRLDGQGEKRSCPRARLITHNAQRLAGTDQRWAPTAPSSMPGATPLVT